MSGAVAVVFPGQGTQRPGMGARFCSMSPAARETFERGSETLGRDLHALCFRGSPESLRETENAQPALFVTNAAALAFLDELGVAPDFVAGHSVGEFSAYYAGRALSFEPALLAVQRRADLMATVSEKGAMAAIIGLDHAEVEALCKAARSRGTICIAAHNAPDNFVCSGAAAAVDRLASLATARGALRVSRLRTSQAFHSSLMHTATPPWRAYLAGLAFDDSRVPIALNTTGELSTDASAVRRAAADQLDQPIRWAACVRALLDAGDSKVLSTFTRASSRDVTAISMSTEHGLRRIEALAKARI